MEAQKTKATYLSENLAVNELTEFLTKHLAESKGCLLFLSSSSSWPELPVQHDNQIRVVVEDYTT